MRDITLGLGILIGFAAIGFVIGLAIGRGTRSAISGATRSNFKSGVLTVEVDAGQALRGGIDAGLASLFR